MRSRHFYSKHLKLVKPMVVAYERKAERPCQCSVTDSIRLTAQLALGLLPLVLVACTATQCSCISVICFCPVLPKTVAATERNCRIVLLNFTSRYARQCAQIFIILCVQLRISIGSAASTALLPSPCSSSSILISSPLSRGQCSPDRYQTYECCYRSAQTSMRWIT